MLKNFLTKLKQSLTSVLPVTAIVLLISATPLVNFTAQEILYFSVCTIFLVLGITLFNLGADIAMTPMGEKVGGGLIKSQKLYILLIVSFLMGVLITVAEPDLEVLVEQLGESINGTTLIISISIGVGVFLVLAIMKIVLKKDLNILLTFFYLLIFALTAVLIESGNGRFAPLAFDSGGVTTGPITVPFIMAFGIGIANSIGGRNSNENSFGIIALCSIGPIVAVLLLTMFAKGNINIDTDYSITTNIWPIIAKTVLDVTKALGLIIVFFLVIQFIFLKLPKERLIQLLIGILYTFIGLVLFLSSVKIGYMPIGFKLGNQLSNLPKYVVVIFAFILGAVVVLAEPAVQILNKQVEDVTGGTVTKKSMFIALAIGVGFSIAVSILRVIYEFSILYLLIPGYLISLALSLFVPKIYTAIAFDSGGVASGPLTSSFILPLVIGACEGFCGPGKILSLAFGVVAMVAMIPLITIQALGFRAIATEKMRESIIMRRILDADDEQIIDF